MNVIFRFLSLFSLEFQPIHHMLKIKHQINSPILITSLYLAVLLPATLIVSAFPIDVFYLFADDPVKEAEDLIKLSDASIAKATSAIEDMVKIKAELEKAKELKKTSSASLKTLDDLRNFLDKNAESSLKKFNEATTELTTQEGKFAELIARLRKTPQPAGYEEAAKKIEAYQKDKSTPKTKELAAAKNSLAEPVNNVVKSIDVLVSDLQTQINQLSEQDEQVESLLKSLADKLPKISFVYDIQGSMDKTLTALQPQLKKIVPAVSSDLPAAFVNAKTSMAALPGKVENWLDILTKDANKTNTDLIDMRIKLDKDLQPNAVPAIKMLDGTEEKDRILNTISALAKGVAQKTKTESITKAAAGLDEKLKDLKARNGMVREGLAGDYRNFVNDFVPLYYFTDVSNLMHVLNPATREIRDVSALREEANAARRKVTQADLDLAAAQETVSGLQIQKRNLVNELKDAEDKFTSSSGLLADAERRLSRFAEDDPKRRASKERVDDLTKEKAAAETEYNALKDEEKGLPSKIRAAETALLAAQSAVQKARSNLIMLVQDESLAFVKARDNEPVFFAPNDTTSKDPIKQVIIYAFGTRKILYLRGTKDNVNRAKSIISFFDRPAPQARLALWTMELNSKATKKGSENFSDSLEIVDNQLSNTRAQIAATLSFLRECINKKVNEISNRNLKQLKDQRYKSEQKNEQKKYTDEIDDLIWSRYFFYQDEVLLRLGFDPKTGVSKLDKGIVTFKDDKGAIESSEQAKIVSRYNLPDPVAAGTLGEILVILSLAKPEFRDEIFKDFSENVQDRIDQVTTPLLLKKKEYKIEINLNFALTKQALAIDSNTAYSPIQREIVNSITLASVPRLKKRLEQFSFKKLATNSDENRARNNLKKEITTVLEFLWHSYGISTTDLFGSDFDPNIAAGLIVCDADVMKLPNTQCDSELINKLRHRLSEINNTKNIFRLANSQIAKTDNMVKQLIDAFDEDINRSIVQPTIYGLRRNLLKRDIGVGIIDRTSLLATNRLVARVDARGSAQLTIGEEQDALLAAQQLANLYLAAKTGGLLGGLSGLKSVQQQKETSEVYGINSGSVFKVTPVFDPSGQALRFQFDHTLANLVTEPDGSIQPALPRVERHTVNTEVQLSNLELREISRFEANSKLGIPTTYKGGVPIFRDIPYVNKVPLLGWFVRRSGRAAVIQESLVLGQTTMYPTIADMFDLLSGDDYNIESAETNNYVDSKTPSPTPTVSPIPSN